MLFIKLRECVSFCTPAERTELAVQFPRWRTLFPMLVSDVKSQQGMASPTNATVLPMQFAWQMLIAVGTGCKPTSLCARRGCSNAGKIKCPSCNLQVIKYCGEECRTAWVPLEYIWRGRYIDFVWVGIGTNTRFCVAIRGQ